MKGILPLAALAAGILAAIEHGTPTYRFDEVKSKVLRAPGGDEAAEVRVAAGDAASAGDLVRTGFWGKAVLSVPERRARFEIGSSTRARLAAGDPGVLLTVERGRIKAFFEALTDGSADARTVAAPGALLAVRGTRYGLEVAKDGRSFLAVFEGTVEVRSMKAGAAPLLVRADEACTFGPKAEPQSTPMRSIGMSEHSWGMHGGMGMSSGSEHGMPGAAPEGKIPQSHGGSSHGGSPMGPKGH